MSIRLTVISKNHCHMNLTCVQFYDENTHERVGNTSCFRLHISYTAIVWPYHQLNSQTLYCFDSYRFHLLVLQCDIWLCLHTYVNITDANRKTVMHCREVILSIIIPCVFWSLRLLLGDRVTYDHQNVVCRRPSPVAMTSRHFVP